MVVVDDLKRWLSDCINNARKEGLSDEGILQAFLEVTSGLLEMVILSWDDRTFKNKKRNK